MPQTIALLNQSGKKIKDLALNDEIFGIEPNQQVIYDCVNAQRAAMRQGTNSTKTRAEVRGGGRKPYKQKGTGRARQGSIRAIQWRGGGIAFGPKPRDYELKVNKKVRHLGLKSVLSFKVLNNKAIAVDAIAFEDCKTKSFVEFLKNIKVEGKTLIVCTPEELTLEANNSARNIDNCFLCPVTSASLYDILCYDKLVMTLGAINFYEEVLK